MRNAFQPTGTKNGKQDRSWRRLSEVQTTQKMATTKVKSPVLRRFSRFQLGRVPISMLRQKRERISRGNFMPTGTLHSRSTR
ncbi:hypothetical protein OSTOST_02415 [Ostertagia ostertagi]